MMTTAEQIAAEGFAESSPILASIELDICGHAAIELAKKHGARLDKFADPLEGARQGLTIEDAEEVAAEDPSLIRAVGVRGDLFWARRDDDAGGIYCATPEEIQDAEIGCAREDAERSICLSWHSATLKLEWNEVD